MGEIVDNSEQFVERVFSVLEKFLRQVLLKIQADAVKIIDREKAYATGRERKNLTIDVYREAARIVGAVGITKSIPYGVYHHEGTKPHWPPIEAIQKWVVQKGFVRGAGNKPTNVRALYRGLFAGGVRAKRASAVLNEARNIAFLIARKISKEGTTGLPFLRMALNQNVDWIASKFKELKFA